MPGNDAIKLAGTVIEALPAGRYRVQLVNGHCLVARVVRRRQQEIGPIPNGDRVWMAVSPSDMSQGVVEKILERKT
jgi:translation initiation factor IF-1